MIDSYDSEDDDFLVESTPIQPVKKSFNVFSKNVQRKSKKQCKYFQMNKCMLGDNCFYQHSQKEIRNKDNRSLSSKTLQKKDDLSGTDLMIKRENIFKIEQEPTKKNKKYKMDNKLNGYRASSNEPKFKFNQSSSQKTKKYKFFNKQVWRNRHLLLEKVSSNKSISQLSKRFFSCKKLTYLDRIQLTFSDKVFKDLILSSCSSNNKKSNITKLRKCSLENDIAELDKQINDINLSLNHSITSDESASRKSVVLDSESDSSSNIYSFNSFF
jgi:hypothetical protein